MKRRLIILAVAFALLAFLAIPMGMKGQTRDVETFTFADLGYENAEDVTTVLGDDVTLTFDAGTNANNAPKYYNTGTAVRMYSGNTLEVALNNQAGETRITAIDFTFAGNYTGSLQNWTGSETSVSFTNTASGQARIQVIAVTFSEGGTPTPTTYTVTYNCNGGTSGCPENVTGIEAGRQIQLAAAPTRTDYSFDGWSDGNTTYQAGANYTVNSNVTFTAQWTAQSSGDEQWVLTNLADLTSSDVFVIVGNNGSDYAMANDCGTSNPPTAISVTVTGDEITSAVAANIQWNISGNATDGYTFYPNGSTTMWLYCYNNNNGLRVGTSTDNTFVMNSNYLYNVGQSRYVGIYNSQNWRCYTSINSNIQNQTFAFYKKVTGGVIPPSITAANVDIAYNATSGSIAYTINNGVTGGTMSVATESDWLTLGQGTTSPISFTCTANEGAAERTATVILTYTYNRATATANVTVTQAGNPNVIDNISDITTTGVDYAVIGTVVAASARGFVIGDGTGYVYTYLNAVPEVAIGDIKKISGTMGSYNHVLQFTNTATIEDATNSNYNNTPAIQVLDATGIGTYSEGLHLSDYVQIEGTLTISGNYYNIAVDGLTTSASISYPTDEQKAEMAGLENKHVVVKGYFAGVSSGHFNVLLGTIEEVVSTEPSITIPNATVNNVPAEGAEGTIEVIYQNFTELSATIYFCNAEGEEATYDWISAEVNDDDNIEYTVSANNGEARTAYLKVFSGNVYSNLVTINQEAYVAPTYAELPFEFDGGKADIANTDGLYQEGLGGDYSNSPKLKFDGSGDWLLLQFQEEPGTLTFDIKGNPSAGVWAGTFKVQTSVDGVTYTDLETYTNLTNTVQSEIFTNLGENVRYIKWIYTEKVSGNVALGNIHLYEFGGGPVTEYELTVEPFENLEIFTFVGGDENNPFEGAGTIQVTVGDQVMLSITANEGYEIQSLMVDGVEHVNDITDDATYTFTMPDHNVTISATAVEEVPPTPFEPATYTLVTSDDQIVDGKSYIIVGSKEIEGETHYYAMGEQRNNNRGGVAISVDGNTATVETADVHEFVISDVGFPVEEWEDLRDGGGTWQAPSFYSIYDNTDNSGYLYAASSIANQLKTEAELDNNNGLWEIYIDTVAHIVASGSSNRNVMQFNYNNNNPTIFSCYAEANQSPVYLYVKDEATTVVTQTTTLTAGPNWFSTYLDITLDDLKAALVAALPANSTITIKNATQNTQYTRGRWMGALDWNVAMMYKIVVPTECEITLEGMPLDPAEHPITVAGGGVATWIGFPFSQSMTVTDAFAGFAANGDIIKSSTGNSQYTRGRWMGAVTDLQPGVGYIYISAENAADRTLVYPTPSKATKK